MAATVLFRGKKVSMYVKAWGFDRMMIVQPGVATTDFEMGILVWLFEDDNPDELVAARLWGLVIPHNLLACWRGMLVLQEVKSLDESDLCNAFYAGQREPHENDKYRIDEIALKIGSDTYNAIMASPIPDEVVNLIIKLTNEGEQVALWPITEEVNAGTLQWRDDFALVGAKHPQQVADREVAEKRVISQYDAYLADYAKSHRHPRECLIMWNIEGSIVDAVEKGVEAHHGEDVVLGIAIARAHAGTTALVAFFGFSDEASFKRSVNEGVREAAIWLASRFKTGWIIKRPKHSTQDYESIIQRLNEDWQNMPVTHPLLPA